MKKVLITVLSVILVIQSIGCSNASSPSRTEIRSIAYDVNAECGYTVYVKEDKIYTPYLVLTNKYNGNVLLLREYVMTQPKVFNDYYAYYEDSKMDQYLNSTFLDSFSNSFRSAIINSNVEITKEDCLGSGGIGTKEIRRKVFLLSMTEVGITALSYINHEGEPLKYFSWQGRRSAKDSDGKPVSWLLRTPDTAYEMQILGIGTNGILGGGNASDVNGVRPAFCVTSSTVVRLSNTVVPGKCVYIVGNEK